MEKTYFPQPGDLLLVFGDSFFARGIDAVEEVGMDLRDQQRPRGTPMYFHVAVYVGGGKIIEALGRGLTVSPVSKYAGCADVYSRDITKHQRDEIVAQAGWMLAEGFTYSWFDIFVQFVRLLFRLRIPWRQKHSVICSVFGWDCWASAGIYISKNQNSDPEDIAMSGVLKRQGRLAA